MRVNRAIFYTLLALASANKEITGYTIVLVACHITGNPSLMRPGAVYPILKKLKTIGWVHEVKAPAKINEPIEIRRKFYQITGRGRQVLIRELRQLDKVHTQAYRVGLLP